MKRRLITLAILFLAALAVYYAAPRRAAEPVREAAPPERDAADEARDDEPDPRPLAPEHYPPIHELNRPGRQINADLRILSEMFHHYQMLVKDPSGNPVGDNAEIVRALQGRNRARLVFVPTNHPALNDRGELVDRWGTPFFFHALAGHSMEVRSAGPDRDLWTADDAVFPRPRPKPQPAGP